jgi:phosphoserine aminotransferase
LTVIPIVLPDGRNSKSVQAALKPQNMAVGSGYGAFKDTQIRIANFPQHTKEDISRLTEAIDLILKL